MVNRLGGIVEVDFQLNPGGWPTTRFTGVSRDASCKSKDHVQAGSRARKTTAFVMATSYNVPVGRVQRGFEKRFWSPEKAKTKISTNQKL